MTGDFNPFSLKGKKVVVTGASSGIGRQCAIDCSRMGAAVALVARNEERLNDTLRSLHGTGHICVKADLSIPHSVDSVAGQINTAFGKIDGVVNCAGISTTIPYKLVSREKLEEFFATNVYSSIELSRELSKVRSMNPGGSVIFMASVMGCVGESGKALYSMTKGALIAAARSLACELSKRKIRVNCISPGAVLTPINENLPHMADPDRRKILEERHPLGLGQTSDISSGAVYLLSDSSRWVTGQNIVIDGGYTAI